jgi:hypothetical protein
MCNISQRKVWLNDGQIVAIEQTICSVKVMHHARAISVTWKLVASVLQCRGPDVGDAVHVCDGIRRDAGSMHSMKDTFASASTTIYVLRNLQRGGHRDQSPSCRTGSHLLPGTDRICCQLMSHSQKLTGWHLPLHQSWAHKVPGSRVDIACPSQLQRTIHGQRYRRNRLSNFHIAWSSLLLIGS